MTTLFDADQLSQSLIPDTEGSERSWRNYSRVCLTSLLRQMHRANSDDVGQLYQLLSTTPVEDLRDLLSDTPAGPYLAQDNGKFFGAVGAVANTNLAGLEHVARQTAGYPLSVRNWVNAGQGGGGAVLFLPYQTNQISTLRGLISTWMRLAIYETVSQPEGDARLWLVVDEPDALGAIDGPKDALVRLRKFGGRCVLGFQSIAQVSGTYGQAEAQTIVENCGNTLILRCSASEGDARFASKLIGEREILREQTSKSWRPEEFMSSKTTSEHVITEAAVLPSEIEQLPDLAGYMKFAIQARWRRIVLYAPSGN